MKALRWAGASLLGLLGGILGLVGVILCATLILLPLGIPVLFLAKRLFKSAGQLTVPRALRHPVQELKGSSASSASSGASGVKEATSKAASKAASRVRPSRTTRVRRRLHLA